MGLSDYRWWTPSRTISTGSGDESSFSLPTTTRERLRLSSGRTGPRGRRGPGALKKRVTTFFGGGAPWSVVVPNDRLVRVINDAAEFQPRNREGWGWFMAQVPVTTEAADPKNDKIPLMGLTSSFFVRERNEKYVLEFESFHL
jgi:hypothetical protein